MSCACGCGRMPSPGKQCVVGHNVNKHKHKHPYTKAERNRLILERMTADKAWGAGSKLARELGISRERVRQIYVRERKRVA